MNAPQHDRAHASRAPWYRRRPVIATIAAITVVVVLLVTWRAQRGAGDGTSSAATGGSTRAADADPMAGMDMSGDGSVMLSSEQIRHFGVTFGEVASRALSDEVRTVGSVMADETRITSVTPRFAGYVERLYVNATGQSVRRGQALADVYSPELLAAQEELLVAQRLQERVGETSVPGIPSAGGGLLDAARQRLRLWEVSDAQIDEVLRTGRPRRTITLHAPASGVVTVKDVVQGQAFQAGTSLYTITDLSRVWLEAQLRATDAALVREGSLAELQLAGVPGETFYGRVTFVYPDVDVESRTLRARIVLANPAGRLRPGMYATVRITTSERRALTVPRSAVIQTGERAVVFVDMGGGRLMPHEVRLGRAGGDFNEVLDGVEAGQRVVTSAQFLLEAESSLADVMRSMVGMGAAAGDMGDMSTKAGGTSAPDSMKGMNMGVKSPSKAGR
ncbi:MAG: efflux RND transporter periplasmic adaptor subunit [Gemmatimonadaceae bacterium]